MPALLFDLDGTLTDPRPGIAACIRYALERLGRACPADDALASFIGPPLRGTFGTLLQTTAPARIEDAMRLYRERFSTVGLYENRVYDGIEPMLDALASSTPHLFVATSKPAVFAERILAHFGLGRHFAGVYGPDLDGRFDDKAELLAHLLQREGLAARGAVMIGDRAQDVLAARANGMRSLGVLWGYGTERELREAAADGLCLTPDALPGEVARLGR